MNSFLPGTLVLLADGSKKVIQTVALGDEVLATDPDTGKTTAQPVIATITGTGEKDLVTVTTTGTDGETSSVTATAGHPFWVGDRHEWVDADELTPGDWLRTSAGTWVQITAIEHDHREQTVHNLTIANTHTYYVEAGGDGVLTHNCGVDIASAKFAQTSLSETFSKGGLFSGRSIDSVAESLRSGVMSATEIPINVVVRGGTTLITNTRSAQALIRAGVPRGAWNVVDRTGDELFESLLSGQLQRNGLSSAGVDLP